VLADLLDDWNATSRESFDGVYVVGTRWSPATYELKDFLAKSQIPYRWMEPDATSDPRIQAAIGDTPRALPVVIFPDGSVLEKPDVWAVAAKLGLASTPSREFYDVVIIGAWARWSGCALYCSTEGMKTVLVNARLPAGRLARSSRIENYLHAFGAAIERAGQTSGPSAYDNDVVKLAGSVCWPSPASPPPPNVGLLEDRSIRKDHHGQRLGVSPIAA